MFTSNQKLAELLESVGLFSRCTARQRRAADTDVRVAGIGIRMFRTLLREFSDLSEQLLTGLTSELREARKIQEQR